MLLIFFISCNIYDYQTNDYRLVNMKFSLNEQYSYVSLILFMKLSSFIFIFILKLIDQLTFN
jgi:hypothetical protein